MLKRVNMKIKNLLKMDLLTKKFSDVSISPSPKKLLYVDAYNNAHKFYDLGENVLEKEPPDHWDFATPLQKIEKFVSSAEKTGYLVKLFIKQENVSEEEIDKWMDRREKEAMTGIKSTPPKLGFLLAAFFSKCGVEVNFSFEEEIDDTLASHAHHDKACILSRDRDFFRFTERNYNVYSDFSINLNGLISFQPHNNPTIKFPASKKKIISPPPKTLQKNVNKSFWLKDKKKFFGCPTALLKQFSNPYLIVRPLRQAVYARLGIKEKEEYIILWDEKKLFPVWDVTLVKADPKYDHLIDKPLEAVEEFFNLSNLTKPNDVSERVWFNHIYCIYSIVFELCTFFLENSEEKYFEMMQTLAVRPKNYKFIETKEENKNMLPYNAACQICRKEFGLDYGELFFFKKKGLNIPKTCKECRQNKKNKKNKNNYFHKEKKKVVEDFENSDDSF